MLGFGAISETALSDVLTPTALPPDVDTTDWVQLYLLDSYDFDFAFGADQGDIIYRDTGASGAAGAWRVLAPGTAGQVLITGGAAANPAWGTDVLGSIGTTDAAGGRKGEYLTVSLASASGINLPASTATNILSLSLTAGDWDVNAVAGIGVSSGDVTNLRLGISTTSATLPAIATIAEANLAFYGIGFSNGANNGLPVGPTRIKVSSTTTVYLVCNPIFSTGTLNGFGFMRARRVR